MRVRIEYQPDGQDTLYSEVEASGPWDAAVAHRMVDELSKDVQHMNALGLTVEGLALARIKSRN